MSDDEDVHSGEESEEEEETKEEDEPTSPAKKMAPPEDTGPSEAERAMQKRRQGGPAKSSDELDEDAQELLEANRLEREKMEEEIQELRERSQQRKKEREQQERELAERRSEEESRRKQEEEDRKNKKDSEDNKRREARDQKMAEFDKFKNVSKPNFVISKRDAVPGVPEEAADEAVERKSKEQVEAEKRAILAQRIQPLDISGFDANKLTEKAKELNTLIYRLESDKYDLEKRFKEQQFDMMELADKARQMNQVGRGGLKRIQLTQEESDPIQEKFAGAPSKIVMFSQFERQMDKRKYTDRHDVFHGPTWVAPPDRIAAYKNVIWDENTGLPSYQDIPGMVQPTEEGEEEE